MPPGHSPTSWAGFVAELLVNLNAVAKSGAHAAHAVRNGAEHQDAHENRMWQRDRRIGLALMAGSSLISLVILYGAWALLRVVL